VNITTTTDNNDYAKQTMHTSLSTFQSNTSADPRVWLS